MCVSLTFKDNTCQLGLLPAFVFVFVFFTSLPLLRCFAPSYFLRLANICDHNQNQTLVVLGTAPLAAAACSSRCLRSS